MFQEWRSPITALSHICRQGPALCLVSEIWASNFNVIRLQTPFVITYEDSPFLRRTTSTDADMIDIDIGCSLSLQRNRL